MPEHQDSPALVDDAPETPSVADDLDKPLDPRSITVVRLIGAIVVAIIGFVLLAGVVVLIFVSPLPRTIKFLLLPAWIALLGLMLWFAYGWPAKRYRYISYRVGAQGIRIRRGVFWRSETSVPRSRVQHTDVSRGPLERSFDLATLVIHTAGTEDASVSLSGLPHDVAFRIRDHLIGGDEDDAV